MRQLVVTVSADEVELASDALWSLGVVAIEERRLDDGLIELWTSMGDDAIEHDVVLPTDWPHRFVEVDSAIADTWRDFASVVEVEPGLFVRPAWVPYDPPAGSTVLHIEPGSTFGMGDHPTTRLCLSAVHRLVTPGATVLDVGCGSGVLAIAACRFGASRAVGVDIAPAAVPVAAANALANGEAERVSVSTTPLESVDGVYDLVLANILAPALVALADDLRRVLAPGGSLVISGILEHAHAHVLDALRPLRVEHTAVLDGWAAVTMRH